MRSIPVFQNRNDCSVEAGLPKSQSNLRNRGFTVTEILVSIAIVSLLLALLLPAVQAARESSHKIQCRNNLHQMILAVHQYEETFTKQVGGVPGRSWRNQILGYLGSSDNAPGNPVFACPSDSLATGQFAIDTVSYRISEGLHYERRDGYRDSTSTRDITDGLSQTAAFSEVLPLPDTPDTPITPSVNPNFDLRRERHLRAFPTTLEQFADDCDDPTIPLRAGYGLRSHNYHHVMTPNKNRCVCFFQHPPRSTAPSEALTVSSLHPGGVHVALADGAVRIVSNNVNRDIWWAIGTRAGGEAVSSDAF